MFSPCQTRVRFLAPIADRLRRSSAQPHCPLLPECSQSNRRRQGPQHLALQSKVCRGGKTGQGLDLHEHSFLDARVQSGPLELFKKGGNGEFN